LITYDIPDDPRFDALRREAEHYRGPSRAGVLGSLHIEVAAGRGEDETYTLVRTARGVAVRGDGLRGAVHGFHHALRLMGFGFSFFADARPRELKLAWPMKSAELRVTPAFKVRGMLPWGNLLNSINVWNFEDYQTYLLTLWRWGGNMVWFHNYDADPYAAFRANDGKWSHGKPYAHSFDPPCGATPGIRVSDYPHGMARHFPDARRGVWGAKHAFARDPIAAAQAEFRRVIAFAKSLGVDTAFGFELRGDPSSPGYRASMNRRIRHVLEAYPELHTLCLWQSERSGLLGGWPDFVGSPGYAAMHRRFGRHFDYLSESPARQAEGVRLATVFSWAYEIARGIRPGIRLAFSGWGGDRWLRWGDYWRGLHECLPGDATLAQLDNIIPRWQPHVSEAPRKLSGRGGLERPTWTALWIESDMGPAGYSSMWHPQENLDQWQTLARSAAKMGYDGLFAQNWNTAGVELSAAFVAQAAWTPEITARAFRRTYGRTFFGSEKIAPLLEALEALGPGWTGTSQQTEWTHFSWDSHPPFSTERPTPAMKRLYAALHEARESLFEQPFAPPYPLTSLIFQSGQQLWPRDCFERLRAIRPRIAALQLRTPHARRLLATIDFVVNYELIKRQLDTRGHLAAQQSIIQTTRANGLKPDPRLVRDYQRGVANVERLWKRVFAALARRLDTRSDFGTLATVIIKAYAKWKEFRAAVPPEVLRSSR
jgi:hypothetical protein